MDEGLLVTLVEAHGLLYAKQNPDFKNLLKRENAWQEIASAMNVSVEECQRVWTNLRTRYVREKKIGMETHSGREWEFEHPWPLFNSLRFLDRYIVPRKTSSNVKKKNSTLSSTPSPQNVSAPESCSPSPSTSNTSTFEGENSAEPWTQEETVDGEQYENNRPQQVTQNVPPTTPTHATKKKRKATNSPLEETLSDTAQTIATFFKERNADDSDKAFAEYVHLTLKTFNRQTKNKAKMEIMSILNKYDVDDDDV